MTDRAARERSAGGRRRSEDSRDAILREAVSLLVDEGYAAVSIEKIAARAGTGKQTIYRWWPSKGDVLMQALAGEADVHIPLVDEGSWTADLRRFLADSVVLANKPRVAELLRALLSEAQLDPAFAERFRTSFLQRRRTAVHMVVERAQRRGDLPAGLTRDLVADVVLGVLWYRLVVLPQPFDEALVEQLVHLLAGVGAPQHEDR